MRERQARAHSKLMNEDEKKRGGVRLGAGRPKGTVKTGSSKPGNKVQFVLPDEVSDWVKSQGGNHWAKEMVMSLYREAKG